MPLSKLSVLQPQIKRFNPLKRLKSSSTYNIENYLLHKLEKGPPTKATLTKEDAYKYLKDMNMIRRMQQEAAGLYKEKLIRGFLHLYSGQEAICVGGKAAMKPLDTIITSYRSHGWLYMMGASLFSIVAELAGRKSGLSKGKGGSMHMFTPNFYGANGIVGAQIPIGTGLGFAHKYKGIDAVSLTLYGDGAANQGQCFEAFNMAKLWKLPVIYICENNIYSMGTSLARSAASTLFYTRGDYIPGIQVNGMDILAVRESLKFAREYVLKNGPIIIEFLTYRYFGHSMSDPGKSYRSHEEVQKVRQTADPILLLKNRVLQDKLLTEDDLKKIDNEVKVKIKEVIDKARKDQEADKKEIYYDVYAKNLEGKLKAILPWSRGEHKNTAKSIFNLK